MLPDVFHHNKERDAVFEFGGDTREGYIKSRGGGVEPEGWSSAGNKTIGQE